MNVVSVQRFHCLRGAALGRESHSNLVHIGKVGVNYSAFGAVFHLSCLSAMVSSILSILLISQGLPLLKYYFTFNLDLISRITPAITRFSSYDMGRYAFLIIITTFLCTCSSFLFNFLRPHTHRLEVALLLLYIIFSVMCGRNVVRTFCVYVSIRPLRVISSPYITERYFTLPTTRIELFSIRALVFALCGIYFSA